MKPLPVRGFCCVPPAFAGLAPRAWPADRTETPWGPGLWVAPTRKEALDLASPDYMPIAILLTSTHWPCAGGPRPWHVPRTVFGVALLEVGMGAQDIALLYRAWCRCTTGTEQVALLRYRRLLAACGHIGRLLASPGIVVSEVAGQTRHLVFDPRALSRA